jgi:hypothetical protein
MADLKNPSRLHQAPRLNDLYAVARYKLHLVPWQLSVGSVLLMASLLMLLFMVLPHKSALSELEQDVGYLRKETPKHRGKPVAHSPQTSLNTFYRLLPPEAAAPRLIGQLLRAATSNGLAPENVEYQLTRSPAANFSRYQVTLPVHADYVAVRRFAVEVLNTLPNSALSEISFIRDEADQGQVQVRLRFSIYLRNPEQ